MKHYILYTIVMVFAALTASAQTSVTYSYDNLNRLTEARYSNGVTVTYAYDALGNRTSKTVTDSPGGGMRGDVDGDGKVDINDVTALISYLLNGDASIIDMGNADCLQDGSISIDDLTALISYLLKGNW